MAPLRFMPLSLFIDSFLTNTNSPSHQTTGYRHSGTLLILIHYVFGGTDAVILMYDVNDRTSLYKIRK